MSIAHPKAHQKEVVRRYFGEVLDKGKIDILDELATIDCVIHRPEMREKIAEEWVSRDELGMFIQLDVLA